eukprot:1183639-Prorocentrum_minimum.AAC.9
MNPSMSAAARSHHTSSVPDWSAAPSSAPDWSPAAHRSMPMAHTLSSCATSGHARHSSTVSASVVATWARNFVERDAPTDGELGSPPKRSQRTNQMQEARVYSHHGPIRCRKRGYILTTDQSDAGSADGRREESGGMRIDRDENP